MNRTTSHIPRYISDPCADGEHKRCNNQTVFFAGDLSCACSCHNMGDGSPTEGEIPMKEAA